MDENLSTTPVRGAPQASSPTDTASTATSTAVSATGITTPFSPEATASAPTPPLFNQTNVRKHEYWQFAQLIAPADALPEGKKAWTTDDAVGIWCLRCSKALSYQKGSSQSIRYHMETKHPAELVAFRDRLAKIKVMNDTIGALGESGSLSVTSSPASGTPNGRGTKRKESPGIEAAAQQLVPEPVGQQASSSGASVSSSTSSLYEIAPTTLDMNASLIPVSTAPAPAASAPVSISTPASHASITPSTAPTTTTATAITRAAGNTNDDLTSWHRNVQRRSGFWGNAYWYDLNLCRRMPLAKPMLNELIAALPPCDSKRVIDLCAGSGRASAALLAAYPTAMVTLVDSSSERLMIAQKRLMEAGAVGHVQFVTKAISPDKSGGSESITNSMPVEVVIGCLALHVLAEKPKHYQAAGVAGNGDGTLFSVETTYEHIFRLIFNSLTPGGHLVFADHVGQLGLFAQLQIMAKVGFVDVDCAWRQEDSFVAGGRRPLSTSYNI